MNFIERLKIIEDPVKILEYKDLFSLFLPESCIKFINTFCCTFDPRNKKQKIAPFILYRKQEEFIYWLFERLKNKENGVVDKCRDVGATWCFCAFSIWLLCFHKEISIGMYTYKGSECDQIGDVSTIFGKLRFIVDHLPKEFVFGIETKHMYIKNKSTESDIAGASGDKPGRSGRRTVYFKDESAFYENPESVEASTSETSDCIIDISTHSGTNTIFYKKIEGGQIPVFVMDWWDNPKHTQEWYNKKKNKAIAEGLIHVFKREIERDPLGSVQSVLIQAAWSNILHLNEDVEKGKIISALDVADGGIDTNSQIIIEGNNVVHLDEWGDIGDTGKTAIRAFWKAIEYEADEFRYDLTGVGSGVKSTINMIKEKYGENRIKVELIKEKLENDIDIDPEEAQLLKRYEAVNKIVVTGWNAGGKVIRPQHQDYSDKPNVELFENAKAQAYYRLREYIYNTYLKHEGKDYDSSKLISFLGIKDNVKLRKLIAEISQVQHATSSSGRLMINKKPKGSKSPNLLEALVIATAEVELQWLPWKSF